MTNIIAIANHKGGSGKTTTAYYLGLTLADMGQRVLLIDFDDQATLTSRLHAGALEKPTIADVLDGHSSLTTASYEHAALHLDYISADHQLAWIAARMQASSPNHAFLRHAWQQANMQPDFVLIDCPPSAGVLLINALALADFVLIPATPTEESYAGVLRMQAMIGEIEAVLNHSIAMMGVVATAAASEFTGDVRHGDAAVARQELLHH